MCTTVIKTVKALGHYFFSLNLIGIKMCEMLISFQNSNIELPTESFQPCQVSKSIRCKILGVAWGGTHCLCSAGPALWVFVLALFSWIFHTFKEFSFKSHFFLCLKFWNMWEFGIGFRAEQRLIICFLSRTWILEKLVGLFFFGYKYCKFQLRYNYFLYYYY